MPNVQILVLDVRSSFEIEVSSDQQINTVDLVCNNNVRNVKIIGQLPLATIRLINKLFPQMERLRILIREDILILFVRTLLSNRIDNSHLFSLMFYDDDDDNDDNDNDDDDDNDDDAMIKQLKTMIDNEKLLDNYDIKRRQHGSCLWW
ncbi:unnamed protein product [Adineta steineri]|uniref:Uncharacterized protein n=2 Tax=Adineta steineri TaxID=433720 RepID=A0A815AYL8_9BILA|nr:unnamed protein product [Adineta steineri]